MFVGVCWTTFVGSHSCVGFRRIPQPALHQLPGVLSTLAISHQVDFRSSKMGQRMIPMLVCPSLLVTQIQMASSTVYDMIWYDMIWYDMIYNTLNTPTDIISRPWVSVARESYFMWDSPWLVNLWRRPLSRWCLGNMFLSLQPLGHFWWPLQSTGFTLSRWVSQWIGWAPVPTEWDGKVLHRSAQNGTGAWKEMCRCSCRAMPCQLGKFFVCEAKFSTVHSVQWKSTSLDKVRGSTFCSTFAAVGFCLKHFCRFLLSGPLC